VRALFELGLSSIPLLVRVRRCVVPPSPLLTRARQHERSGLKGKKTNPGVSALDQARDGSLRVVAGELQAACSAQALREGRPSLRGTSGRLLKLDGAMGEWT
jgi:hypothetical protein